MVPFTVGNESSASEPAVTVFGAITCFGFLGGAVFPAVGLALAEVRPILAFGFFSACYVMSAILFAAIPESGHLLDAVAAESSSGGERRRGS